jgi:BASS family bile acid:Na+ symporter
MDGRMSRIPALFDFVRRHFLGLLLGSYAAAALWPAPGLRVRGVSLGEVALLGEKVTLSLPVLMLGLLLCNAGLGVRTAHLKGLLSRRAVLLAGLAANLAIPVAFIFGVTQAMRCWHNPDEVQQILVGLALVASMPVAGSSTAWSQNAQGNMALSLGLVLASTVLSPLTTPVALHAAGLMASGGYAATLHELAASGTGGFLAIGVVAPSLLGMLGGRVAGEARIAAIRPHVKLANAGLLLALNYSNAAVSLPQAVADHDWDFLAVLLPIVVGLCVLAFAAGWCLARLLRTDAGQRTALMFGLGMNNNGTGLVLASTALATYPRVMLPIIFYNLIQHVVAGAVDATMGRTANRAPLSPCGRGVGGEGGLEAVEPLRADLHGDPHPGR